MATVVEFNNATLADAIKRANIVAPTRGRELDMYKGFVFDLDPEEEAVILRTTNGELFYTEFLYPKDMEVDQPTTWRVASSSTHGIVSNLPMSGTCKFKDEGGKLRITSGRMRASTPLIRGGDYPDQASFMFEPEGMFQMKGFGSRLDLVGWAVSSDGLPPRAGVYMDEEYLCASNGKLAVRVPNEYSFADGRSNVVMPYSIIGPILRSIEELEVGVLGNNLIISPTEDIYIKCGLFEERFDPVNRMMSKEHEASCSFDKETIVGVLSRVSKIGSSDRQIALDLYIAGDMMTLAIKDRDSAEEIEESLMLHAEAEHDDMVRYLFSVETFTEVITKAPGKDITMMYNPSKTTSMVKFTAAEGFEAAVMPRVDIPKDRGA
ncbi:DNA polymerase III sliding clamp [Gordonia phage Harambe]|uniref:DNA polymerase III sliding clamp n=7 Tax=Woesvirus woes TaxID=1982751 RepID=A0A2H4PG00_9CAUD|nr:DNA polymerase III sliding clamp [Gordonia phage Anamika]AVP43236.1 DNA polymerase III sliding clamp [Gordonia phage Hail2Pitt]QAX94335.1 DNA polymerase III sliding clamp [Gordonia phage Guillaume]QAX94658.1 DNA polymerase III sliding clamp [Gordonia phage Harambe]QAX95321.1 DNA polymerase III sliding clamp [Gordonia phage Hello]QBP30329.1 DNA polymerase III sliding clamp [Gordonia phage Jormungandr]QBP30624.1 DNA polymerase III sliding clamp [Gordonia phage Lahirium]